MVVWVTTVMPYLTPLVRPVMVHPVAPVVVHGARPGQAVAV